MTDAAEIVPTRFIEITMRDGTVEQYETNMGATATAEMAGLNPISAPNAYLACIAYEILKLEGHRLPATFLKWAQGPNRPKLIRYVDPEDEPEIPSPTTGPQA